MKFSTFSKQTFLGSLALLVLLATTCKSEIVVFGDSLSDTGNTSNITNGWIPDADDGYFQGRFSNGLLWIEHLATILGEPVPTPSTTGGTNFAHGGSQALFSGFFKPSLSEQVDDLLVADPDDLHVVWIGANDLLNVDLDDPVADQYLRVKQVVAAINDNIDELYSRGARKFLVFDLPPLGATPLATATLSSADIAQLNILSAFFNTQLAEEMDKARFDNRNIDIFEFDIHALFDDAIANPGSYGLTNVTDSATPFDTVGNFFFPAGLATGPPPMGVDPDDYLFYDGLHATSVVHSILASEVATAFAQPKTKRVWTVDQAADDRFSYEIDGTFFDNNALGAGNNAPKGMASDQNGFHWVIDDDDSVYVYDSAGNSMGSWLALGLVQPQGIAVVGNDVLIVDRGPDKVFVFANAATQTSGTLSATTSWSLNTGKGNRNPRGITSDGVSVWVANASANDRVYKYDLSGNYLGRWNLGKMDPGGIALDEDGSTLWIVDPSSDSLLRFDNAASRTSGSASPDATFALDSANSAAQGVAQVSE